MNPEIICDLKGIGYWLYNVVTCSPSSMLFICRQVITMLYISSSRCQPFIWCRSYYSLCTEIMGGDGISRKMYSPHCQKSWCLFLCNSGSDAYQMFAVPMVMVLYLAPQFVKCQEFCLKWFETHCRNAEKSWSLNCVKYFQNWHYKLM